MKLKIRYENEYQTIELDCDATEKLWIGLSLKGDGLTQEQREDLINKAWEIRFNRPDYNNWHKADRHTANCKAQQEIDEEYTCDLCEPLMSQAVDDRIFRRDEIERDEKDSYEDICGWVRSVCGEQKKHWADAFIAVRLDGMSVNDYAASAGITDPSIISKYLARAEKKLKENFSKRQI